MLVGAMPMLLGDSDDYMIGPGSGPIWISLVHTK